MSKRVFISSTYVDLVSYRATVQKAIRQLDALDVSMENFGARDERPKDECLRLIQEESDVFVGVYAHRYGYVPIGDTQSVTEAEYEAAALAGIPRFIYLVDDEMPWKPSYMERGESETKLHKFKERLKTSHICKFFSTEHDLAAKVAADLGRHFSLPKVKQISVPQLVGAGVSRKGKRRINRVYSSEEERMLDQYLDSVRQPSVGISLVHIIRPSEIEGQKFDVFIYLVWMGMRELPGVDHAEFFLGAHWDNRVFRVENEGDYVGISTSAYAPFLCACRVTFEDGHEVYLNRYIDFEMGRVFQ